MARHERTWPRRRAGRGRGRMGMDMGVRMTPEKGRAQRRLSRLRAQDRGLSCQATRPFQPLPGPLGLAVNGGGTAVTKYQNTSRREA